MTKQQILKAFLEDEKLVEEGYLREGEAENASWSNHPKHVMITVIKDAINGVMNGESQALMTRKMNQFLDRKD